MEVLATIQKEQSVRALQDFLTTDYGLMSLGVITFMLGMGVFFTRYFIRHMREDQAAADAAEAAARR